MGQDFEHGQLVDEQDRPLTGVELQRIARGHEPAVGNGVRTPFDQLDAQTLRQYQQKAVETRRLNAQAKKLAERAAYFEAHREHMATILGGKMAMMEGLLAEMIDPATQKPDTKRLSEKRLKLLHDIMREFEKQADMTPSQTTGEGGEIRVNVTHTVAKIIDQLGP